MQNRDEKVAALKEKKALEQTLIQLKDYKDEDMRRHFYLTQLKHSVYRSFDALNSISQEMPMLEHRSELIRKQGNPHIQEPMPEQKPMKVMHIGKEDLEGMPDLF